MLYDHGGSGHHIKLSPLIGAFLLPIQFYVIDQLYNMALVCCIATGGINAT